MEELPQRHLFIPFWEFIIHRFPLRQQNDPLFPLFITAISFPRLSSHITLRCAVMSEMVVYME